MELTYLAGAEQGAQPRLAQSLSEADQGKFITGISQGKGEAFLGVFQSINQNGVVVVLDENFRSERHQLVASSRLVMSDQEIPLSSLEWNATSVQSAVPQGQTAEPEGVEVTDVEVTPTEQADTVPEQSSKIVAAVPVAQSQVSKPDPAADHHRPPMPSTVRGLESPTIGV